MQHLKIWPISGYCLWACGKEGLKDLERDIQWAILLFLSFWQCLSDEIGALSEVGLIP